MSKAKSRAMEIISDLDGSSKGLFEKMVHTQFLLNDTLQNVKKLEARLLEQQKQEQRIQKEREAKERLREIFVEEPKQEAVPVKVVEVIEKAEKEPEKIPEKAADKVTEKTPEKVQEKAPEIIKVHEQEAVAAEEPKQKPQAAVEKPQEIPSVQNRDTYQPRIAPSGPRENFQPRTAQAGSREGYQPRVAPAGTRDGYQPRPASAGPREGYQPRVAPAGTRNGYQPRPGGQPYQPRQGQAPGQGYQQRDNRDGQARPPYQPRQGQAPGQARPAYQQRDGQPAGRGPVRSNAAAPAIAPPTNKERVSNYDPNKSAYTRSYDVEKKVKSKKAILKEAAPTVAWDEERITGPRKPKAKKAEQHKPEPVVIEKAIITTETVTVKDLSEKIGKPAAEIIKKLFTLGMMATINQEIDFDTCALIASDFGIELVQQLTKTYEDVLQETSDSSEDSENDVPRPPVVTIMGHVDHGKTSLLDAIRSSKITEGEAGGITQHIGAYMVSSNGRPITFIDTPGHEAFTSMRARGAQVTDLVIIVVAADDGIMPQTVEAINHAKAAKVPIIVAINKMDKPGADPERIKQQLTEYGLVSEEWGGDTICVEVSAKTHMGLDSLLEMILLQSDVLELKANQKRAAKGTIIEAKLDKGRGPVATVLVQNGTLRLGDTIVAGTAYGRVRAMMDDKGARVEEALPSQPVEVLGFSEVPDAGDVLNVVEVDKLSRQVAEERKDKQKAEQLKALSMVSLDDLFNQIADGQIKELNVIIKTDVQGSVEAIKQALEKLSNNEVRVRAIHGGVGAITETDINLAAASNAIIIGFNVRPDNMARVAMEHVKVDVRLYRVIYNAIEDIEKAMKGMLAPEFKDVELGQASVRNIFKITGAGTIAGCYVTEGKVTRNAQVRVVRDGIVVYEGKIESLKRFKDDAKEVAAGYECGIGLENFSDIKEGDMIEAFVKEEIER